MPPTIGTASSPPSSSRAWSTRARSCARPCTTARRRRRRAARPGRAVLEHERIPFDLVPVRVDRSRCCATPRSCTSRSCSAALDEGIHDEGRLRLQRAVRRGAADRSSTSGSFEPSAGGPWPGYRQFCQTMLFPLLLAGPPRRRRTSRSCAGSLDGLRARPTCAGMFSGLRRFRKGVVRHVYLHSARWSSGSRTASETIKADLKSSGFVDGAHQGHGQEAAQARARASRCEAGVRATLGLDRLPRHVLVQRRRRARPSRLRAAPRWPTATAGLVLGPRLQRRRVLAASPPSTPSRSWPSTATRRSSTCLYRRLRATRRRATILPLVMNLVDPSRRHRVAQPGAGPVRRPGPSRRRAGAGARPPPHDRGQRAAARGGGLAGSLRGPHRRRVPPPRRRPR